MTRGKVQTKQTEWRATDIQVIIQNVGFSEKSKRWHVHQYGPP